MAHKLPRGDRWANYAVSNQRCRLHGRTAIELSCSRARGAVSREATLCAYREFGMGSILQLFVRLKGINL